MEPANAAIVTVNNNGGVADVKQLKVGKSNKKKVNVLKAALLTLFGRSRKTTKCIQAEVVADANNWAMLVGCVRPTSMMLMPDDAKKKEENKVLEKADENQIVIVDQEEEEEEEKLGGSLCSSECGGDSRYASALNLQELDKSTNGNSDEDDNEDELFDDTQGDVMIDMKAEMFIAQFYAQMKMDSEHNLSNF